MRSIKDTLNTEAVGLILILIGLPIAVLGLFLSFSILGIIGIALVVIGIIKGMFDVIYLSDKYSCEKCKHYFGNCLQDDEFWKYVDNDDYCRCLATDDRRTNEKLYMATGKRIKCELFEKHIFNSE